MKVNSKVTVKFLASFIALCASAQAGNIIINPDFASPNAYPAGGNFPGSTELDGWTSSTSGVHSGSNSFSTNSSPFWDNGTVPVDISTVGFMQVSDDDPTASLSQILNLDIGTTYDFSFLENARTYHDNPVVEVLLDSTVLVGPSILTPVDSAFTFTNPFVTVSGNFTATATTQTLVFFASQQAAGQDGSWLLTDVSVSAEAPEPGTGSTFLFVGILALVGGSLKLRFRKPAATSGN